MSRFSLGADPSGPILEVIGLVAGYAEITVLDDVNLRVFPGITCVIGPNGAGKSTLLRAIFGMADVRRGRILFDGQDLVGLTPLEIRRRGLSYVAQGRWNFPHMSVRENLEMGAFTRHDDGVRKDILALEERFPLLRQRAGERAGNLSGGEQQILEMAMALMSRPRLVLMDEPSLGLAPAMISKVFDAITTIAGLGVAVLMVEQNARQALGIATYGIVLDLGRKVLEGPPSVLLADEHVKRALLGEAFRA